MGRRTKRLALLLVGVALALPAGCSKLASEPEAAPKAEPPRAELPPMPKRGGLKAIVTERDRLPGRLPPKYVDYLNPRSPDCLLDRADLEPDGFMAGTFYFATDDPERRSKHAMVLFLATDPASVLAMVDELTERDRPAVERLKANPAACLVREDALQRLGRKPGDRLRVKGLNFSGVDLELEVAGTLPESAGVEGIIDRGYLDRSTEEARRKGFPAEPAVTFIWLRVPDRAAFARVKEKVESSRKFSDPMVKCELLSRPVSPGKGP